MSTIFEIKLTKVLVQENGFVAAGGGTNLLTATLIYPREGVPSIVSTRPVSLEDNKVLDYTEKFKLSDQLIFKEAVRDQSFLRFELSSIAKANSFSKILVGILGTAAAAALAAAGPGGPIVTAVLTSASGSIFEDLKPSDEVASIGMGSFLITEKTTDGERSVELRPTRRVELRVYDRGQETKPIVIEPGRENGQIHFNIRKIATVG